ncbi:MAG TPA: aminotransferase class V-fold PLP-dependent enzyme [Bryobacteraceae bacterium]|nr:aminotransferase class V-fold PLP-dependent enzyme [Bryobacteraceae bacterium]
MSTPLRVVAPDFAALRQREFARLDATGCVYLDYTGAALYPASLVSRDAHRLATRVMGNPHAQSTPSLASTEAIEKARRLTLRLLDAKASDYEVIFTANATGAMRILAEAFPFQRDSRLVLTADNHNSVNGLRVPARKRGAQVDYTPLDGELRAADPSPWLTRAAGPSLFAFPAQSNFSGAHHPLAWVRQAQESGYHVLLDAAAYLPSRPISLTEVPADFVALSYYKLFGYPTGVGALVGRREALTRLRRGYFGGGTVQFASVENRFARFKDGADGFEDGTANFLAMPSVCDGLEWLLEIGMWNIQEHVQRLTGLLLDTLAGFGDKAVVYGPRNLNERGGTVAFNLRRAGRVVPFESVEAASRKDEIAIRGGCFCNPGAAEQAFDIPANAARACLQGQFSIPRFRRCLGGRAVGALRASIGLANSVRDIQFFSGWISKTLGTFD